MKIRSTTKLCSVCLLLSALCRLSLAQGTAFTYQGRLQAGGSPANGRYDLCFSLYDAGNGGARIGNSLTNLAVAVSNGLFTVTVDFGPGVFDGGGRWLEVGVRSNGVAAFTSLSSRQWLTATPYASYAGNAASAGSATVANSVTPGAVTSAGLAVGAVTADKIASGAVTHLDAPGGSPTNVVQVSTNGWVGFGTNRPSAALEVAGGAPVLSALVLQELLDGTGSFTNLYGVSSVACATNLLAAASATVDAVTLADTGSDGFAFRSSIRQGQGAFTNLTGVAGLAFSTNKLLAVASGTANAVTLIDVSTPTAPVWRSALRDNVGSWSLLSSPSAVAFNGNVLAIAAYNDNAVTLANVANPAAPALAGYLQNGFNGFTNLGGPRALAFNGNLLAIAAYTSNAVTLVDISSPASPVLRATLKQGQNGFNSLSSPQALAFSGSLLAVASYTYSAVTLVDATTPAAPVLRSVIQHGVGGVTQMYRPSAVAFLVRNGRTLLAVTARNSGALSVFDVTDPARPELRCVAVNGLAGFHNLLYVSGVVVNANNRLVFCSPSASALTLLGLADQQVGLVSDSWVGIGTSLPKAPLDVSGDVLIENATRFQANATHLELGERTSATGSDSLAAGFETKASGTAAAALGNGTTASGDASTASGYASIASGSGATALGYYSLASGAYSTALGYSTQATNGYAFAAGNATVAGGAMSAALGNWALALHDGTFVWADSQSAPFQSTKPNQFLVRAIGGVGIGVANPASELEVAGTVTADAFAAPTNQALILQVNGQPMLTLGTNTLGMSTCTNSGLASMALGYQTAATAPYSVALGHRSKATNSYATAFGESTIAGGESSFAAGVRNRATGDYSTAMGYSSYATGPASTALGNGVTAAGMASFAAGMEAAANHAGSFVWADTSGGTFASQANNQFLIRAAGGVGINKDAPSGALDVNGNASFSGSLTVSGDLNVGGRVYTADLPSAIYSQHRDQRLISPSSSQILATCTNLSSGHGVFIIMGSAGSIPFSNTLLLQLLDYTSPTNSVVLTQRHAEYSNYATSTSITWAVPVTPETASPVFALRGVAGSGSSTVTILDVNLSVMWFPH